MTYTARDCMSQRQHARLTTEDTRLTSDHPSAQKTTELSAEAHQTWDTQSRPSETILSTTHIKLLMETD